MADDRARSKMPTHITVTVGSTKVSVEVLAPFVLDRDTSDEIKRLVSSIARLADGSGDG